MNHQCQTKQIDNVTFYNEDAGKFMVEMARNGQKADDDYGLGVWK